MNKQKNDQILNLLLYAGAVYFLCVALVHILGVKIPGLFVYYNVPSYSYQDRIISFLSLGWAAFFFLAARKMDGDLIRLILIIGFIAILALIFNTFNTNFKLLDPRINKSDFTWILVALSVYWLGLVVHSRNILFEKK